MRCERGSVSVVACGVVAVVMTLVGGITLVGRTMVDARRATTAADAAALAAADELALGGSADDACPMAHEYATANAATLVACVAGNAEVSVVVRVGRTARGARAVIDPCVRCSG